jgi:hypothetical protein
LVYIFMIFGFYKTDKDAEKALMSIEGIILDREF